MAAIYGSASVVTQLCQSEGGRNSYDAETFYNIQTLIYEATQQESFNRAIISKILQILYKHLSKKEESGGIGTSILSGLSAISGISAFKNRNKANAAKEQAEKLKKEIELEEAVVREDLNKTLNDFGKCRLAALEKTTGVFLQCLEQMDRKYKEKCYDILEEVNIPKEALTEIADVTLKAADTGKILAVGGGAAAVALAGTPAAVTAGVTALATASTGTAISTLSGAAATNAVLAWLGGGAIAAGGGGMAAGAAVLTGITVGTTAGVGLLAAGLVASKVFAKKATAATNYLAETQIWTAKQQASLLMAKAMKLRALELQKVTLDLEAKAKKPIGKLAAIIESGSFEDVGNEGHSKLFQQCAMLAKAMSELSAVPVIDPEGNLSQLSAIETKTRKVLNTEL